MLAVLALLAALPADARPAQGWTPSARAIQARLAGGVVQVGCRQGQCIWLRVVRVETVTSGPRGELRRLVARRGISVHGVTANPPAAYAPALRARWDRRDRAEYAFCSRERPAYAFPEGGDRYLLHYLDLFVLGGYQYASATMYMRLCHDRALPGNEAALRRLGYRPGARSGQVENGAPEDLARF